MLELPHIVVSPFRILEAWKVCVKGILLLPIPNWGKPVWLNNTILVYE